MYRKALVCFLGLACVAASSGDIAITADKIRFTYQSFEDERTIPCTHRIQNAASQDWEVVCENQATKERHEYTAHLWVTEYVKNTAPKLSYEILYWVTDWTHPEKPVSNASTTWFRVRDASALFALNTSLSVDGDMAALSWELVR